MPRIALTRKQCEDAILQHLIEIQRLYKQYHPNGDHLSIGLGKDSIFVFNAHWEENDMEHPLDFYFIDGRKGSVKK